MRFLVVTLFLVVFVAAPAFWLASKLKKCGKRVCASVVLLVSLVLLLMLICVHNYLSQWVLWLVVTLYLPLNVYMSFCLIGAIKPRASCWRRMFCGVGAMLAALVFFCMLSGMVFRNRIEVRNFTVESESVPAAFDGVRIVHITDLHLGNLVPLQRYLYKISATIEHLHPDVLVFTGDLVSMKADEGDGIELLFDGRHATMGRYAVLGNHDYGDYVQWPDAAAKAANMRELKNLYRRLGFTLLNDSVVNLTLGTDSISIIGVENCGKDPFPCYGDLAQTVACHELAPFSVLLTHDPNHWQDEVLTAYNDIDLTLSGHTHSAQVGFDFCGIKFSPSQWIFEYWDGLYRVGDRCLVVSRGLGYVGVPFRLGMRPEVSVITLKRKSGE